MKQPTRSNMRVGIFVLCTTTVFTAWAATESEKRLQSSTEAFGEVMSAPDKAIPQKLLNRAQCIVIVPGMKKAALGVGGTYGRGFVSCREAGSWGAPAGIRLAGGSFGLQLGVESTDVILLVMNQTGINHVLSDKFTVGGEATAAIGPVGRDATAETDALLNAEIISYSRTRGIFAGVSLNGTVVTGDKDTNQELYGKPLATKEVIQTKTPVPPSARPLTSMLLKYAPPPPPRG